MPIRKTINKGLFLEFIYSYDEGMTRDGSPDTILCQENRPLSTLSTWLYSSIL